MPKNKKMRNNASSVLNEQEMVQILISNNTDPEGDSKELLSKQSGLRKTFRDKSRSPNELNHDQCQLINGDKEFEANKSGPSYQNPPKAPRINKQFTMNMNIEKILEKQNFPFRYPIKIESQDLEAYFLNEEAGDQIFPISTTDSKITRLYIKFWNKVITKQDMSTRSVLDHQLTENESGYYPCQVKTLFNSPDSYLKKPFCHKMRYSGQGHELLPSQNQFFKISKRSLCKFEVNQIFLHYSNPKNQYFLIPIELSSKLSRCMLKSMEICQISQGCNKIEFSCNSQNIVDQIAHPILTIEYKNSIEEEILPCSSLSLVNNYSIPTMSLPNIMNRSLYKALINCPYLSHFLDRNDFSIDNFFAKCWHYSRYFCSQLDLGFKLNTTASISIKDAFFKYLLASSARICIAIKYWVMNPECATYFRCWCGQKVYDAVQESKLLKKFPIGSANLFNYQKKVLEQDLFHKKHGDKKSNIHICACHQEFKDHQSWISHALSTKLSDLSKICPVVMFNISKSSEEENKFVCECSNSFSDYDFWTFWIHVCNCKIFRNAIKKTCHCAELHKDQKSQLRNSVVNGKRSRSLRKRKRSQNKELKENKHRKLRNSRENENLNSDMEDSDSKLRNLSFEKQENDINDNSEFKSGDKNNLPLKFSDQINFGHGELPKLKPKTNLK